MLDEAEFAIVSELYLETISSAKELRTEHKQSLETSSMKERFAPVCRAYTEMTGFLETNANAIMHHRISIYGPICQICDKPFRTPKASYCASCGNNGAIKTSE